MNINDEQPVQTDEVSTSEGWVYQLINGEFYKKFDCERKGLSLIKKPLLMQEITTSRISKATIYPQKSSFFPVPSNLMLGGKWVPVTVTKSYELDQPITSI